MKGEPPIAWSKISELQEQRRYPFGSLIASLFCFGGSLGSILMGLSIAFDRNEVIEPATGPVVFCLAAGAMLVVAGSALLKRTLGH